MVQKAADQQWQQMQDHIENLFGHLLKGDIQRIEYKPQFTVSLLEMPSGNREQKPAE